MTIRLQSMDFMEVVRAAVDELAPKVLAEQRPAGEEVVKVVDTPKGWPVDELLTPAVALAAVSIIGANQAKVARDVPDVHQRVQDDLLSDFDFEEVYQ